MSRFDGEARRWGEQPVLSWTLRVPLSPRLFQRPIGWSKLIRASSSIASEARIVQCLSRIAHSLLGCDGARLGGMS